MHIAEESNPIQPAARTLEEYDIDVELPASRIKPLVILTNINLVKLPHSLSSPSDDFENLRRHDINYW